MFTLDVVATNDAALRAICRCIAKKRVKTRQNPAPSKPSCTSSASPDQLQITTLGTLPNSPWIAERTKARWTGNTSRNPQWTIRVHSQNSPEDRQHVSPSRTSPAREFTLRCSYFRPLQFNQHYSIMQAGHIGTNWNSCTQLRLARRRSSGHPTPIPSLSRALQKAHPSSRKTNHAHHMHPSSTPSFRASHQHQHFGIPLSLLRRNGSRS